MVVADLNSDDYYKMLGVPHGASDNDIKKAFRKLAMKWHPDKHATASDADKAMVEAMFKRITEANDVLSDSAKRKAYDHFGKEGARNVDAAAAAGMPACFSYAGGVPGGTTLHFGGNGDRMCGGGGGMDQAAATHFFSQLFDGGMGGDADGGGGLNFGGMGGCGIRGGNGGMGGFNFGGASGGTNEFDLGSLFGGLAGGGMPKRGRMGFGGIPQAQRRRTEPMAFDVLAEGTQVTIAGLSQRPDLNGMVGMVLGVDRASGRYIVQKWDGSDTISLKPDNVVQLVDGVRLANLMSQPQLNGQSGAVVGFDGQSQRFAVQLDDGSIVKVRKGSVLWPQDTLIRVNGLKNAPHYNGKWGRVKDFDGTRYAVQFDNAGSQLKLKPENVHVTAVAA